MTLSDFINSGKAGSRATIYRKLHEAGIEADTLRGADGQLTNQGLTILGNLFDSVKADPESDQQVITVSGNISGTASREAETAITISKDEYTDLIRRAAEFETLAAERQLRIADLQGIIADMRETQQRLLPAVTESGEAVQKRQGFFSWFRRK